MIPKCEHGVYNPDETAKYCTVCNPIPLYPDAHIEVKNGLKIAAAEPPTKGDEAAQVKWDATLEKNGLGLVQPITDNSEGEMASALKMSIVKSGKLSEGFERLRTRLDGNDTFMGGHQITRVRDRDREIPEWAMSDTSVRKIITTSFPGYEKKEKSRQRAGRWIRVIYLYYRMQLPRQIVGKELKLSEVALKSLIRSISRAAKGQNAATAKPRVATSGTPPEGKQGKEK